MPKYMIEREVPGVSSADWKKISQKSSGVVRELAPNVQWVESFVTDDKVYCVYIAPDKESILEHAKRGGFPADRISEVRLMADPTTAETQPAAKA